MSKGKMLSCVLFFVAVVLPQGVFSQTVKLGFVDYERVLAESEDGKAAKSRFQKWVDAQQKDIDREQEILRKEKEALDKQATAMSEDMMNQRASQLQKKVMDLNTKWERLRAEAAGKERQELEPILSKIDSVVASIANKGGYVFIFDKKESGIRFAQPAYDLTTEVLRAYNALPKMTDPKVPPKK